jgi:hypothetical protein
MLKCEFLGIENELPYLAVTLGDDGDKLMNSYYKWV